MPPLLIDFDGSVRTDAAADSAAYAVILADRLNVLVALGIDLGADLENVLGAELNAIAAALASFINDFDHCHVLFFLSLKTG